MRRLQRLRVVGQGVPQIWLVQCWVHARRNFVECEKAFPVECGQILDLIGKLYEIEQPPATTWNCGGACATEESRAVIAAIQSWVFAVRSTPGTALHAAITYMTNRWSRLTRFVDNPALPLDNNPAERALRGPVVGRRTTTGRDRCGGRRWRRCSTRCSRARSWWGSIRPRTSGRGRGGLCGPANPAAARDREAELTTATSARSAIHPHGRDPKGAAGRRTTATMERSEATNWAVLHLHGDRRDGTRARLRESPRNVATGQGWVIQMKSDAEVRAHAGSLFGPGGPPRQRSSAITSSAQKPWTVLSTCGKSWKARRYEQT